MFLRESGTLCPTDAGGLQRRMFAGLTPKWRSGTGCWLAVLLLVCVLMTGAVSAAWNGGGNATWYQDEIAAGHDGSAAAPFLIYDEASLAALADETNTNTSQNGFVNKHILLKANLDLKGASRIWEPIGNTTESTDPTTQIFQGTFNGDNHTIANMNVTIISSGTVYAGLFGFVQEAVIQNVNVTGAHVNATGYSTPGDSSRVWTGGLAGYVKGSSIENCNVTGSVNATGDYRVRIGGLAGYVKGSSIETCYAAAPVTATGSGTVYAGGLAGEVCGGSAGVSMMIMTCTATGRVTSTGFGYTYAGGLAGNVYSGASDGGITITSCNAFGTVNATGSDTVYVGGLAGCVYCGSDGGGIMIANCVAFGTVNTTGDGVYAGGLAGEALRVSIKDCLVRSTVDSSSSSAESYTGGLAGKISSGSSIESCHVTGSVNSTSSGTVYAGGLAGYVEDSTIMNCHVTGSVNSTSSGTVYAGGLAGYVFSKSGSGGITITDCTAEGLVNASSTGDGVYAGGLAGRVSGSSIENCHVTGSVNSTGSSIVHGGGLAGGVTGTDTITNSAALNEWVNASSTDNIGRLYGEGSPAASTNSYAWRYMGLNISGSIVGPVPADQTGNATNASTVMIWDNETFFQTLFGQTNYETNWTMGTDADYRLPVLKNAANHNADARHLNRTHEITAITTGDGTITPESAERPDGAAITFTLMGIPDTFTDNDDDATDELSGNRYTIADVDTDHTIVAGFPAMPHVDTASIAAYNTTAANITLTLTTGAGADGAWINLTSQSDQSIISTQITGPVSAGSFKLVRLTGFTPGHAYQLNITPLNTTIGGTPVTFTCSTLYTAPVPEIVFENATTGTPVTDSLTLTNGQTTVIRANITNTTLELINETVSWAQTGTGFTTSDPGTAYPYTITLTSDINADGTITITVGGILKTLRIISPSPPSSSEYSVRVLFETSGGSFISPATLLSPGDRVAEPPAPVKDGYTFGGWYTDETCTKAWNFSDSIPGDMTLYAKWSVESTPQTETPTAQPTATAPASQTETPTAQPTATTPPATTPTSSSGPTSTEAPAPVAGLLIGLLAAGTLFMRKN